jgi:signal peptidase I
MSEEPTRPLGTPPAETSPEPVASATAEPDPASTEPRPVSGQRSTASSSGGVLGSFGRFVREIVIIVVVALIASALLRAFVVQAFFVPTGSMLPAIHLHDRILVSRIGGLHRGEVVVFEDPGGWIPPSEEAPPPGTVHKALEWIGVLPSSLHEHLVKRVIGLPGDHVVCCDKGDLSINGTLVDESGFLFQKHGAADNIQFDVVVPADHIFVLGDHRYRSGDSSRHLTGQDAFVPEDLITGRAMAVIWPSDDWHILHIPSVYDDVPDGQTPPEKGVIRPVRPGQG